jgi:Flp pilus assembly protein TadG
VSPRDESGSVLMLMPAAVLVLIVLGAVAVDAAIVFMAQRELQSATAAAANDAAVAALREDRFYGCGDLALTVGQARSVAEAAFSARAADTVDVVGSPGIAVTGTGPGAPVEVTVTAVGRVQMLFAPAVAGLGEREVTASSTATAEVDSGVTLPAPGDC